MIRKYLNKQVKEKKDRIKWRSHEVTRIEAFSDAVFAFAVTLLIVSLEVPESFDDLRHNMSGFIPFGLGFLIVFQVWHTQHIFFRRFGLDDTYTYGLNGALLFMVLFFMYPLKFLFTQIVGSIQGHGFHVAAGDIQSLMFIYSGGYMTIFTLFALMYIHVLKQRVKLKLDEAEIFEAESTLYAHLVMISFGAASIIIASFGYRYCFYSGIIYAFLGIPLSVIGKKRGRIYSARFGVGMGED